MDTDRVAKSGIGTSVVLVLFLLVVVALWPADSFLIVAFTVATVAALLGNVAIVVKAIEACAAMDIASKWNPDDGPIEDDDDRDDFDDEDEDDVVCLSI